jgi:hypothetical protein
MNKPAAIIIAMAIITQPAVAAERLGHLIVDVKVTGQEQWSGGGNWAKVRVAQALSYSTVVKTDGQLVDFNPKDAGYYQQQMAKAAQNVQAVTHAQGKKPMAEAEFKARVQKEQAACKGDQQCLLQLAMKASEWSNQMLANSAASMPSSEGSGGYLNYFGFPECGSTIDVTVNDVTEGATADVQGAVPLPSRRRLRTPETRTNGSFCARGPTS